METMTEIFGEVIYEYTRAQAIEDGQLSDLSAIAPDVVPQHYKHPVACTAEVWSIIERAVSNKRHCNDFNGVIHDMLWMSRMYAQKVSETTRLFKVKIVGAGRKSVYIFKIVCGPNDDMSPALTIMMPHED